VLAVEDRTDGRWGIATGNPPVVPKDRIIDRSAVIDRIAQIDAIEAAAIDTLRADAVIDDVTIERPEPTKLRARPNHDLEGITGAGVPRVERPIVGAGVEVTGRARDPPVTARILVPEQRLAEANGCGIVDDVAAGPRRSGEGGSGPSVPRAAFGLGVH